METGNLFCPKCLEEIPWVPEYNTLETIQNQNKYKKEKRMQHVKEQMKRHNLLRRRRKVILLFLCCVFLAVAILGGYTYLQYWNYHSYAYQYHRAEERLARGNYDKALTFIDRAITLEGNHEEAYRLLSEILVAQNDLEGAIKVMESCLEQFPSSEIIYGELLALYEKNGQPDKIKELMDNCKVTKIRNQFAPYITPDPKIDYETGAYSEKFEVTISGECESYYYTLNGKAPSKESTKYTAPLEIGEGVTELNVIGYNRLGIPSDVIYRKYIVVLKRPDAPKIFPEETSFDKDTFITIQVEDGCICYYAFDEAPTTNSTKYTNPINMPEGMHTLYAFQLGANGQESETAYRTYTLTY